MTTSIDPWQLFRVLFVLGAIILAMGATHRRNKDGTVDVYPDHGCSMAHQE